MLGYFHVTDNSICLQPITATTATPPVVTIAKSAAVPNLNVPIAMDPKTLNMQSQVISKQKELLELRQKKLELELLQAKAKLEEQQIALEKQTVQIVKTPQVNSLKSQWNILTLRAPSEITYFKC